jgi:rubrerythrin
MACGSGVSYGAARVDADAGVVRVQRGVADGGGPGSADAGHSLATAAGSGGSAPLWGAAGRAGTVADAGMVADAGTLADAGHALDAAAGSGGSSAGSGAAGSAGMIADAGCAGHWLSGDGTAGGVVLWPCGAPPRREDASTSFDSCADLCLGSHNFNWCFPDGVDAGMQGVVRISCRVDHTGRRPAHLLDTSAASGDSVADVLARAAYLEAASVAAFRELADELAPHAAPRSLLERLHEAAEDEVRHARDVAAFARGWGGIPAQVQLAEAGRRDLLAIALDNAREGCVRETYGVATAFAQAQRAADPALRALMTVIAREEARHAALSWDLAVWLDARLDAPARALVQRERQQAVATLAHELQAPVPEHLQATLGLPSAHEAQRIVHTLQHDLWGAGVT